MRTKHVGSTAPPRGRLAAAEEALLMTGRSVGLIYGEAAKGRKPLCCAGIRGLWPAVNGNIQSFGS